MLFSLQILLENHQIARKGFFSSNYYHPGILGALVEAPWSRQKRMENKGVGHSANMTNEASSVAAFLSKNTNNSHGKIQHNFGLS
jgi:hypothetical protein